MAKPRIFVSSTFYDLRQVREDLERFIEELGYEPVLHEFGDIPYGKDSPLETYAYREIELCDILVNVIGGRYGTESKENEGLSITQAELERALQLGVQVFVFVEQSVLSEFSTYRLNKGNPDVNYRFADNIHIFEFLEHLHGLPTSNPIVPFRTSADMTGYLKTQWAGLFQRSLQERRRQLEIDVLGGMKSVASTLEQLVAFLTKERREGDSAIREILIANHPAFRRFQHVTSTPYRVYFTNKDELDKWLRARAWTPVEPNGLDPGSYGEWTDRDSTKYIKLTEPIFDEGGNLKIYAENTWNDDWLCVIELPATPAQEAPTDLLF